jgi:hypothetical protein
MSSLRGQLSYGDPFLLQSLLSPLQPILENRLATVYVRLRSTRPRPERDYWRGSRSARVLA